MHKLLTLAENDDINSWLLTTLSNLNFLNITPTSSISSGTVTKRISLIFLLCFYFSVSSFVDSTEMPMLMPTIKFNIFFLVGCMPLSCHFTTMFYVSFGEKLYSSLTQKCFSFLTATLLRIISIPVHFISLWNWVKNIESVLRC